MNIDIHIGVDPGKSGAVAVLERGIAVDWCKLSETEHDISEFVHKWATCGIGIRTFATLEQVSAMPRQGVSSTFKFGSSFGFVRGLLVAHKVPFATVTPAKWQTAMKCKTGGDKNITKAAAQRLWPDIRITHANADAFLLAEYGRRIHAASA